MRAGNDRAQAQEIDRHNAGALLLQQLGREEAIARIIAAARKPCPPVVTTFHGGYAFQSRDGSTFGVRRATVEECREEWRKAQDAQGAEFRAQLVGMSGESLANQVAYWLNGARHAS